MSEKKTRKRKGERKDGRIQVTYTDGVRPDGKPNRVSFYGRTRAEAVAKRDEYIADKEAGQDVLNREMTLSEWLSEWQQMYGEAPYKWRPYINHIEADLGKMRMRDIKEAHLNQTIRRRFEGKSKGATSLYRAIIRQIFKRAVKNGIIVSDPSDDLSLPKTSSGTHRALNAHEVEFLCANWRDLDVGLWCMLMLMCGLRRGEMMALQWDCVNLDARTLTVRRNAVFHRDGTFGTTVTEFAKTAAGMRTIPICNALYQILSETPESERIGFVCKGSSGGVMSEADFIRGWRRFDKFVNAQIEIEKTSGMMIPTNAIQTGENPVGLNRIRAHDLRHTFATMLYDAGVDIKSAQYFLGHATPEVTMKIYTHLSESRETESRIQLKGYLDEIIK